MLFSQFYAIFRALSAMRTVAVFMADSIGTDIVAEAPVKSLNLNALNIQLQLASRHTNFDGITLVLVQ